MKWFTILTAIAVWTTTALAMPVSLFSDVDLYAQTAKDVLVVECLSVPDGAPDAFVDELYLAKGEILTVLKGEKKPGKTQIATIYPMTKGKRYLICSFGGHALDTDIPAGHVPKVAR